MHVRGVAGKKDTTTMTKFVYLKYVGGHDFLITNLTFSITNLFKPNFETKINCKLNKLQKNDHLTYLNLN